MTDLHVSTECDASWIAAGSAAKQATLPAPQRRLHQAILGHFLDTGGPPEWAWLRAAAADRGLQPEAALDDLSAADLVHLDESRTVRTAYPFSGVPSGHLVILDGTPPVWAMCAVDALGIPLMTGRDGVITAADPASAETITVTYEHHQWRWDPPGTTVLFVDADPTGAGPAARCFCPHVNFVTSADHGRAYLDDHPQLTGGLLDQQVAVRLAADIFGPLLAGSER